MLRGVPKMDKRRMVIVGSINFFVLHSKTGFNVFPSECQHKELFVMDIVVEFRSRKCPGVECNGVQFAI